MTPSRLPACVLALAVALPALVPAAPALAANAPPLVNYQGVLRDAQGDPLDGSYDMVFRFFDLQLLGSEILVDQHTGAGAVTVTQGLFNVILGSGTIMDGGAALPGDPYLSLEAVFRDFGAVWMEISVEGETLLPRLRVTSAAYALNAANFAGRGPGSFLDTSIINQTKAGALTMSVAVLNGVYLSINADGPDGDQFVAFYDGGSPATETLKWDEVDDRFEFTNALATAGPLRTGSTTQAPEAFNHLGSTGETPDSGDMGGAHDLYVEGDIEIESSLYLAGQAFMKDSGADADQHLWFFNDGSRTGEELKWDEAGDRFEFSDSLALAGPLRTGSTIDPDEAFNHFGDLDNVPDSEDITGTQDLFVEGDVEIESTLYLNGEIIMRDFGGDIDQYIFFYDGGVLDDEWFTWGDGADRFELSDSLHVYGELTALTKNFVQNHPYRDDLEVVYTSLEGDEPAVFTRGSGRLENGTARIALGGSFALVANPGIGLSAHLTPRGGWADLYVESLTPETLVVRAHSGDSDAAFDYVVFGLRAGWEEFPVLRPRRADSPVPADGAFEPVYAAAPEGRALSPLARHTAMAALVADGSGASPGRAVIDPTAARRLRDAIGARDGSEPARPPRPDRRTDEISARGAQATPGTTVTGQAATTAAATSGAPAPARPGDPVAAAAPAPAGAPILILSEKVEPGDVVSLDPDAPGTLRRADFESDPGVVGVVVSLGGPAPAATQAGVPGQVIEAAVVSPAGDIIERFGVAVGGVAFVHVDPAYGAIRPGDLLAASPTPGHAMRSGLNLPGTLLGKALDAADIGTTTIRVLLVSR